jgi:UDP-glucuronate 4-epimerase
MGIEPPRHILLTGAAGFIGFHVAKALLDAGHTVTGVDNLNDYYPVALKVDRLAQLTGRAGFNFCQLDIADHDSFASAEGVAGADTVIHLAAQAGVRYSIDNPFAYAQSNLVGHLSVLELVRRHPKKPRLVYASSSSVYGDTSTPPYTEEDRVDHPVSLYAATKRSNELTSEAYSKLYGINQIGLRFFTVYGAWGRPDMAYWTFTRDIIEGRPIRVFNKGQLQRDFTWIDDIVSGVIATALHAPATPQPLHRIYNIGNNRPVELGRFIAIIEDAVGRKAAMEMLPMQAGDVRVTCANIDALHRDYGFTPTTRLEDGIPHFVNWYRAYTGS